MTTNTQTKPCVSFTQWCDSLSFNRFHAMVMGLAALILIFDGFDAQIIAYVMPQLVKEWHLTPVAAGSMASYGFIGLMIGAAGFGTFADRLGRKKGLMIALVVFSVFSGAAYWAPNFQVFCLLRFLAGIGMGGAMPLTITLVTEFAPAKHGPRR
ncbi:MFS transporter [Geotalea toluenoxydans]|uniref:MFS transporter n=1 Tax=Geotalea toluenoxydans TaxID=421624 RepID=UPI000A6AD7D9|nr:MFS transporter [Geotalea toluenoxydans]